MIEQKWTVTCDKCGETYTANHAASAREAIAYARDASWSHSDKGTFCAPCARQRMMLWLGIDTPWEGIEQYQLR